MPYPAFDGYLWNLVDSDSLAMMSCVQEKGKYFLVEVGWAPLGLADIAEAHDNETQHELSQLRPGIDCHARRGAAAELTGSPDLPVTLALAKPLVCYGTQQMLVIQIGRAHV